MPARRPRDRSLCPPARGAAGARARRGAALLALLDLRAALQRAALLLGRVAQLLGLALLHQAQARVLLGLDVLHLLARALLALGRALALALQLLLLLAARRRSASPP